MAIHSQIHLVPTSGTLSQIIIGQGADYLPLIYSGLGYLPQLWFVDYTSGFNPKRVPRLIVEAIAKQAVVDALAVMSDLIHPIGVTASSLSVDGLAQSRSMNVPAFKHRIDLYNNDLFNDSPDRPGLIKQIKQKYLGINLGSL